jgi:hypothetical protein
MAGSAAPLAAVSDADLRKLCKTLWSWPACVECETGNNCTEVACPYRQFRRLGTFFEHYRRHTKAYIPDVSHGQTPALQNHAALFEMIEALKGSSEQSPKQFSTLFFNSHPDRHMIPSEDRRQALNLAMRIGYMVNCSAQQHSSALMEFGAFQRHWQDDCTLSQFMVESFRTTDHPDLNDSNIAASDSMRRGLMAKKLKSRLGVRFLPTDSLRAHLRYDRKAHAIEIFHHTVFLREHLRMTKGCTDAGSMEDALKRYESNEQERKGRLTILESY